MSIRSAFSAFVADDSILTLDLPRPEIQASAVREDADFWYAPVGGNSTSGQTVTPETAMRQSGVLACVSLLAGLFASLPLLTYKRTGDDSRRRAIEHPVYDLLHIRPNRYQTASEFKRLIGTNLLLRGNFYALILRSPGGVPIDLIPLHPDLVEAKMGKGYKIAYRVTDSLTGETTTYPDSEIFHLRDISTDGVTGLSRIAQQREGIGMAMAATAHGAAVLRNGGRPASILSTDQKLTPDQRKANLVAFNETHGGINRGGTAILDGGAKFQTIAMTNEDAQYLELLRYTNCDVARMFGVPPHLIGETDKSTSWGTGIEQQNIGFLTFTLMPWLTLIEEAVDRDLIDDSEYFSEFLVDALLRADMAARSSAYGVMIEHGVLSPDDVRARENMNPREDGRGGIYWRPANMVADDGTQIVAAPVDKPSASARPVLHFPIAEAKETP
jgi:HK97 family phage portal protein